MGLFLSLFHPSDMFQKSVRCYLIMGAFLIWVPYGGFLWERFLLVGSFGKGVFWKRVLWKGNRLGVCPKQNFPRSDSRRVVRRAHHSTYTKLLKKGRT